MKVDSFDINFNTMIGKEHFLIHQIARHVLDMAGRMVAVGVTTEEIDAAVHAESLKYSGWGELTPVGGNFLV